MIDTKPKGSPGINSKKIYGMIKCYRKKAYIFSGYGKYGDEIIWKQDTL
jgi:hypothetical protein